MQDHSTPASVSFLAVLKWTDDDCRAYLEASRWPDGPRCPKCGDVGPYTIKRKSSTKNVVRKLYRCRACRKDYTVTVGTVFEDSHIPLNKWFAAIYLMGASKKGMSAHQLHRELDIAYRSAWFMCHRVREAMRDKSWVPFTGTVEADETYVGGKPRGHWKHRRAVAMKGVEQAQRERGILTAPSMKSYSKRAAWENKQAVFGILERNGKVRTIYMPEINSKRVRQTLAHFIDTENAILITDEHAYYRGIQKQLPHSVIRHSSEYVRGEIHTQGIESYWAIIKRGLYGVFHHVDAAYLSCYLNEFEFR